MKFVRHYHILLRSTTLFLALFLFVGCSSHEDDELPPARLIKARAYESDTLDSYPLPLNGGGILPSGSEIITELVFDKPVLLVIMNDGLVGINAESREGPPATVWTLESYRLDVWNPQIGWNPERDVTLTIIYEDDIGVHKDTLDVTLGAYSLDVFPAAIVSGDPQIDEINVDANRLNREGITFSFDTRMDTQRTQIEVYSGQVMLDWRIHCWTVYDDNKRDAHTVVLLPESEDDWLLPGQEYEIHLDFYSFGALEGRGLRTAR